MAFWKKFYKSRYTGREIDAAVAKAGDLSKVTANPTLAGTEAALTGLEVGDTKYKVNQPINVEANPTLAGTEAALTGLEVGTTKYKVNQPINVVANPTLAGTEAALEGLQVGETKYKVGGGASNIEFLTADVNGDLGVSYNDIITGIGAGTVYFYKYTEEDPGPPSFTTLCICPLTSIETGLNTPAGDLYTAGFYSAYANDTIHFYSTTASGILNINEPTP